MIYCQSSGVVCYCKVWIAGGGVVVVWFGVRPLVMWCGSVEIV